MTRRTYYAQHNMIKLYFYCSFDVSDVCDESMSSQSASNNIITIHRPDALSNPTTFIRTNASNCIRHRRVRSRMTWSQRKWKFPTLSFSSSPPPPLRPLDAGERLKIVNHATRCQWLREWPIEGNTKSQQTATHSSHICCWIIFILASERVVWQTTTDTAATVTVAAAKLFTCENLSSRFMDDWIAETFIWRRQKASATATATECRYRITLGDAQKRLKFCLFVNDDNDF